jgi:predicted enzyme related to lactoylglutathione lyase
VQKILYQSLSAVHDYYDQAHFINDFKARAGITPLQWMDPTGIPMASLLNTNATEGIQGHITSLGHEPHNYTTFYIQVEDINHHLQKIEAAGGTKLVGPVTLPDGKQFAWFKDPEGNMVGLVTK